MKTAEMIVVVLIALTIGTLMHFIYAWSGNNKVLGYIMPVDECVWEHMKMVVYPMLGIAIYMAIRNQDISCISSMILTGLISIPVMILLFFSYWPFTHHSVLVMDCILYYGTLIAAIVFGNKWNGNVVLCQLWPLFAAIALIMVFLMAHISYHKPKFWGWLFTLTDEGEIDHTHHHHHHHH